MSAASERELQTRISDLEGALKAIGRVVTDTSLTPKRRLERAAGILSMFEALAPAATAVQG
jgi:hypothetical protein